MDWIRENWFFLLFFIFFVSMHLFGHGMHGEKDEHAGHGQGPGGKKDKEGGHGCC